ncbi:MAG: helix-turn-helix transcriptional regulator, partial [Oscillospiraceae bacterium]
DINQKDNYVKLGLNIAYYRKLRKYTQLRLCELLDIDRSYISKIELGNVGVSLDIIFKLAQILNVPVNKFFEFRE